MNHVVSFLLHHNRSLLPVKEIEKVVLFSSCFHAILISPRQQARNRDYFTATAHIPIPVRRREREFSYAAEARARFNTKQSAGN